MFRTSVIAAGFVAMGIITAAPAVAEPAPQPGIVSCSPCDKASSWFGDTAKQWNTFPQRLQDQWTSFPQRLGDSWRKGLGLPAAPAAPAPADAPAEAPAAESAPAE